MSNAEYIMNFLSGELSFDEEQEFFRLLFDDLDFRNEYKCAVRMGESISKSMNRFAPSAALTASVFSANGLSVPTVAKPEHSLGKVLSGSHSTWFTALSSSLLSFVAAVILFSYIDGSHGHLQAGSTRNTVKGSTIASTENQIQTDLNENNYLAAAHKDVEIPKNNTVIHEQTIPTGIEHENEIVPEREIVFNAPNQTKILGIDKQNDAYSIAETANKPERQQELTMLIQDGHSNLPENNQSQSLSYEYGNYGFDIEFKENITWNFPQEQIYPDQLSKFNNLELSILYEISSKIKLGLDIRQETFYAEYTGKESGLKYNYKQQPNFTTFSALIRYSPVEFGKIVPFTQLSGGINSGGYVLRPALGLDLKLFDNFNFIIGADYNIFYFQHDNTKFKAYKAGLYYGVNYTF